MVLIGRMTAARLVVVYILMPSLHAIPTNPTTPTAAPEYIILAQRADYPTAAQLCADRGAMLPMPKTMAENDALHAFTSGLFDFYLGLSYAETKGVWRWADGSSLAWSNWARKEEVPWGPEDQPTIGRDHNHVMMIRGMGRRTDRWASINAAWRVSGVVCQVPTDPATPTPAPEYIVLDQQKPYPNYTEAVQVCADRGATLPMPKTKAENDALDAFTTGTVNFFLGLSDAETEGVWRWADGSRLAWSNWARKEEVPWAHLGSEPNGNRTQNHVVMIKSVATHSHRWADVSAARPAPRVVCQRPKAPSTPSPAQTAPPQPPSPAQPTTPTPTQDSLAKLIEEVNTIKEQEAGLQHEMKDYLDGLKETLNQQETEISTLEAKLNEAGLQHEMKDFVDGLKEALNQKKTAISTLDAKLNEAGQQHKIKDFLIGQKEKLNQQETEISTLEAKLNEAGLQHESKDFVEGLKETLNQQETEISTLEEKLNEAGLQHEMKDFVDGLKETLNLQETEISTLEAKLKEAGVQHEMEDYVDGLKETLNQQETEISTLEAKLNEAGLQHEMKDFVDGLKETLNKQETGISTLEAKLNEAGLQHEINDYLDGLKETLNQQEMETSTLEAKLNEAVLLHEITDYVDGLKETLNQKDTEISTLKAKLNGGDQQALKEKVVNLEEKVNQLGTAMATLKANGEDQQLLQDQVVTLEEKVNQQATAMANIEEYNAAMVAFSAYRGGVGSKTNYISKYDNIKFPEVLTNLGGAYDPNSGAFTAPAHGVYQLAVGVQCSPGTALRLVCGDRNVMSLYSNCKSNSLESNSVLVELDGGAKCRVKPIVNHVGVFYDILTTNFEKVGTSTFSGHLITLT